MILHPNILEALFKHQSEISLKLSNVRGLLKLEHIAMIILNPQDEIIVFSSTPAVEYNLIEKELWRFDASFKPRNYEDGTFFWWEQAYPSAHSKMIKEIKELNYGFTLGFCLARKIDKAHIVYSYATRSTDKKLKQYYEQHTKELMAVGDYAYGLLSNIYAKYGANLIEEKNKKSHLKLVVTND